MGNILSWLSESFPPAPTFSTADIPDLSGKVIIVTGGNAGIGELNLNLVSMWVLICNLLLSGKETSRVLLEHGAKVYIACRSAEKAATAIAELKEITGKDSVFAISIDLSDLHSIKKGADEFLQYVNILSWSIIIPSHDSLKSILF